MRTIILTILTVFAINTNNVIANKTDVEFSLEEEAYIDDIPFDTWEIAMDNDKYLENPGFALEEEEFVNDIPFNTTKVVAKYQMKKAMSVEFLMPREKTINDIPFDTHEIAFNLKDNDIITEGSDSKNSNNTDFAEVQNYNGIKDHIIGILLIILMSAYSLTAFLL